MKIIHTCDFSLSFRSFSVLFLLMQSIILCNDISVATTLIITFIMIIITITIATFTSTKSSNC
uniref:Uncharacterized protein n=1 Tax=Anopheles minimus TaxID=112268 RepID=A0A182WMU4_9DIPT